MSADWRLIAPLACYLLGFALFPPQAIAVVDEGFYVSQAVAFAGGARTIAVTDPMTGVARAQPASPYPIGTSLLQAPFVYFGGWRAAAWLSVIALIGTALVLGRWLHDTGADPAFALMFLLYAPTLVLGRIAMSDVPSACVVTLGLWLLWRPGGAGRGAMALAGMIAGASVLFRETNALLFAPFIVGAIVRRDQGVAHLVAGVAAGVLLRLAASAWMYGDAFFMRDPGAGFAAAGAPANAVFYAMVLTVLLPGGLIGAFAYRGPRRAELTVAVLLTFGLFTFYGYRGASSGWMQQLVLAPRFFVPLVPLMVIACAESFARMAAGLPARLSMEWRRILRGGASAAMCVLAFSVHPAASRTSGTQASIVRAIYDLTPPNSVIIENVFGAQKFINPVYGARTAVYRSEYEPDAVRRIAARDTNTYLVFVDRNDTEAGRADATANARYVARVGVPCRLSLLHDAWHGSVQRLRIWRVAGCG